MAGSTWRLAASLQVLLAEINATYPTRNKASDGTIGDAAHQAVASDHNPNASGVVCALDITHDPYGMDAHALADRLLANRHPDLKYIISNRRIAGAWSGWRWQAYSGSDIHYNHIHISVGVGNDGQSRQPYDDKNSWQVNQGADMIGANSTDVLRIGHTEIGGWGMEAHDGRYDALFHAAWDGHSEDEFIRTQWKNGAAFREARSKAFQAAAELASRPTQENFDSLKATLQACNAAQSDLKAQYDKSVAERADDIKAGDTFIRRLGQFIKKYLP